MNAPFSPDRLLRARLIGAALLKPGAHLLAQDFMGRREVALEIFMASHGAWSSGTRANEVVAAVLASRKTDPVVKAQLAKLWASKRRREQRAAVLKERRRWGR